MTTTSETSTRRPTGGLRAASPDLELVVQRIRLRLRLRLAWLAHLRERGLTEADIATGDRDRLEDELEWRERAVPEDLRVALATAEQSLRAWGGGRLSTLVETFGLSASEVDLLHVCFAAGVDERIARVMSSLHRDDQRRYVTEPLAARLCDRAAGGLSTAESALRLWGIVTDEPVGPGEPPAVRLDRTIVAWLHGVDELDHRLVGIVRTVAAHPPLDGWPVAQVADRCRPRPGHDQPDPTRVVVRGRAGSGRRSFATATGAALGLRTAVVDADRIAPGDWEETFSAVQRRGYLDRCAPIWHGRRAVERPWPARTPNFPVQFLCLEPGDRVAELSELADVVVELPDPTVDDRRRLWRQYVAEVEDWPEPARSDVVERPHTVVGDIVHVAGQRATTVTAAGQVLRRRSRDRLGPLVSPMSLPYRRQDLVVPDRVRDQIDFLVFECRERRRFWAGEARGRLYPRAGLVALLAGPPGVGKTMTAQVIAAELGVDLLRVNLAETISKYVGETAKNLDAVLRNVQELDAVLLCDEADTLFGRRTEIRDAHDRWANADTNFLLQAIETYSGIVLLATNRKDQLDDALTRRLRHLLDLPKPDAAARRTLWQTLLADVAPDCGSDPESGAELVLRLAARLELTGAEIKNAALNAGLVAARAGTRLNADAILEGLDRELSKQGRALSDMDRQRVLHG